MVTPRSDGTAASCCRMSERHKRRWTHHETGGGCQVQGKSCWNEGLRVSLKQRERRARRDCLRDDLHSCTGLQWAGACQCEGWRNMATMRDAMLKELRQQACDMTTRHGAERTPEARASESASRPRHAPRQNWRVDWRSELLRHLIRWMEYQEII